MNIAYFNESDYFDETVKGINRKVLAIKKDKKVNCKNYNWCKKINCSVNTRFQYLGNTFFTNFTYRIIDINKTETTIKDIDAANI